MHKPKVWMELDQWAYDIEKGRYTRGNPDKDQRLHSILIRLRDKYYSLHLESYAHEYGKLRPPPPRTCKDRGPWGSST